MTDPQATKPVFLLTHSRSCSTAIERVFWTNKDIKCIHENFGGAFYFGPERVSDNWKYWKDDKIKQSGQGHVTYRLVLEELLIPPKPRQKHVFIKDMSYHIIPPKDSDLTELPSLRDWDDGAADCRQNPTLLPTSAINSFQWTFLIRSPWLSVPSLYRLHVPPRVYETQLHSFKPSEIGYREMRVLIEYLYPNLSSCSTSSSSPPSNTNTNQIPVLIDASDVLSHPESTLSQFCSKVNLPFSPSMLSWDPSDPEMEKAMHKFRAYHSDAISSSGLRKKTADEEERAKTRGGGDSDSTSKRNGDGDNHTNAGEKERGQDEMGMEMTEDEYVAEWTERYGEDAARKILDAVYLCKDDYAWLRRFVLKPDQS